jgi:anion-transporting  ArsA/GET3 family ATPase
MIADAPPDLGQLVREKKVIVCCGAGGVGKTTTAAALGLAGARAGRRTLVLTIDPARRLAQAMGIPEHSREPAPVPRERMRQAGIEAASLDAWMLNPDVVFENLVHRLAKSEEQAKRILSSRLFRHLSELVAGMQEYTAAEALHTFSSEGKYDLVVLDTPPSRNALDFLDAPSRLSRFLDERILNLFLPGTPKRFGLWRKATELIGNVFTRVFGAEFYAEIQEFLAAFSGMFGPMRLHSEAVRALLCSQQASFLLVTSPEQAALAESSYFRDKILSMGLPFAGFVLNRSWARTEGFGDPESISVPAQPAPARSGLEKLSALAGTERQRVERDRNLLEQLRAKLPKGCIAIAAPYMGEAIEDLPGLAAFSLGLAQPA